MEQATQVWSTDQSDSNAIHLSRLLHLVGIMTSWREGTRIPSTITNRLCIVSMCCNILYNISYLSWCLPSSKTPLFHQQLISLL